MAKPNERKALVGRKPRVGTSNRRKQVSQRDCSNISPLRRHEDAGLQTRLRRLEAAGSRKGTAAGELRLKRHQLRNTA